jgi:hypothetical protein
MSQADGVLSNSKEEMVSKLRGKLVSGDFSELSGVLAAGKWPDSEVIAYAEAITRLPGMWRGSINSCYSIFTRKGPSRDSKSFARLRIIYGRRRFGASDSL